MVLVHKYILRPLLKGNKEGAYLFHSMGPTKKSTKSMAAPTEGVLLTTVGATRLYRSFISLVHINVFNHQDTGSHHIQGHCTCLAAFSIIKPFMTGKLRKQDLYCQ